VGADLKGSTPRLARGVDLGWLKLTSTEGFVLSRVDGRTPYEQIAQSTGLGVQPTLDILQRMKAEGVISDDATPPSLLERLDDGSPVAVDELAPGPGLPVVHKARILRLHRRVKGLSLHELLGVPVTADRSTLKRAYAAASKEVHPDRYYGRDLGPFRERLADIFARITDALDALDGPSS
jgi:DnaJ-domain-containing protein 1